MIWLYEPGCYSAFDAWERHVIDEVRPWRAIFVTSADFDNDGDQDIGAGAWWYVNPGLISAPWIRLEFGGNFKNLAAAYDFDQDGDIDVLGTEGEGSTENSNFIWASNDGEGAFSLFDNIDEAKGDFLQGIAVSAFEETGNIQIALSWHQADQGLQLLTVPERPQEAQWSWQQISPEAQDEALSAEDIDRDGNIDLLLGTIWMENSNSEWLPHTISERAAAPDRNRLVDLNKDGRLDAIIGYENAGNAAVPLAWYEQPATASDLWTEHIIADLIGPMSLDVRDMDHDGDWDIIVGEHNLEASETSRLLIYENLDGVGGVWNEHLVYQGDEHHNGAHVADLDGDGDFDIVSIGWNHDQVIVYENIAEMCSPPDTFLPIIRR
ncbi:MAG: VCBS repeat-containing protein [Caldilineaceae bacterium]|nr:VCBS repeat-containing protein [Caldilineaceae bacterium]